MPSSIVSRWKIGRSLARLNLGDSFENVHDFPCTTDFFSQKCNICCFSNTIQTTTAAAEVAAVVMPRPQKRRKKKRKKKKPKHLPEAVVYSETMEMVVIIKQKIDDDNSIYTTLCNSNNTFILIIRSISNGTRDPPNKQKHPFLEKQLFPNQTKKVQTTNNHSCAVVVALSMRK